MSIACFFIEPTGRVAQYLRRYCSSADPLGQCDQSGLGYHNMEIRIEDSECLVSECGRWTMPPHDRPHDDPWWPRHCVCGYFFRDEDNRQVHADRIYRRIDTGEEKPFRDFEDGAMYFAEWLEDVKGCTGPDGKALMVRVPGHHDWQVDGEASNCTRKGDFSHKCWVRHGDPRHPESVTVDKNGETCHAGAGSILTPTWHGFLRNGILAE